MAAVSKLSPEARKLWFSNVRSRNSPWRWKNTARRSALLASPLFSPAWLRWRSAGSDSHCKVNRVRSMRPNARSARDSALFEPAAAILRRMVEGATAPASMEAFTRISSAQPRTSAAVSTASLAGIGALLGQMLDRFGAEDDGNRICAPNGLNRGRYTRIIRKAHRVLRVNQDHINAVLL